MSTVETKKPGWSHVGGSAMPDTPIETLRWVLMGNYPSFNREPALAALAEVEAVVVAAQRAKSELGVPGENYPAPVANAWELLDLALAPFKEGL